MATRQAFSDSHDVRAITSPKLLLDIKTLFAECKLNVEACDVLVFCIKVIICSFYGSQQVANIQAQKADEMGAYPSFMITNFTSDERHELLVRSFVLFKDVIVHVSKPPQSSECLPASEHNAKYRFRADEFVFPQSNDQMTSKSSPDLTAINDKWSVKLDALSTRIWVTLISPLTPPRSWGQIPALTGLPFSILVTMASFLDLKSLLSLRLCNHAIFEVTAARTLWCRLCLADFTEESNALGEETALNEKFYIGHYLRKAWRKRGRQRQDIRGLYVMPPWPLAENSTENSHLWLPPLPQPLYGQGFDEDLHSFSPAPFLL